MIYDQTTKSSFCQDRMHLSKEQRNKIDAELLRYLESGVSHCMDDIIADIAPKIKTPEEGFYLAATITLLIKEPDFIDIVRRCYDQNTN